MTGIGEEKKKEKKQKQNNQCLSYTERTVGERGKERERDIEREIERMVGGGGGGRSERAYDHFFTRVSVRRQRVKGD